MWPSNNPADLLRDVRERLGDVLSEVLEARVNAEAVGRRNYECHLGNPLSPKYVMVDGPGNAIHVQTTGELPSEQRVTITYFPAWLLSALLDDSGFNALRVLPTDINDAVPVRVQLRVARDLADCGPSPYEPKDSTEAVIA